MKGLTNGTIYLGQGDWLKYEVKENNTTNTPVSLTLEAGTKKDGEYIPPEFLKDHSTLYFDNSGIIVSRAPYNSYTSARTLKKRFAKRLKSYLLSSVTIDSREMMDKISGFFEQGEQGIRRKTVFPCGNGKYKTLEDLIL